MQRKRFNEDVLVRALDYCDEHDMRLGQCLTNAIMNKINGSGAMLLNSLHFMDDESMEQIIMNYIRPDEKTNAA